LYLTVATSPKGISPANEWLTRRRRRLALHRALATDFHADLLCTAFPGSRRCRIRRFRAFVRHMESRIHFLRVLPASPNFRAAFQIPVRQTVRSSRVLDFFEIERSDFPSFPEFS
jgi:hypothetical protein